MTSQGNQLHRHSFVPYDFTEARWTLPHLRTPLQRHCGVGADVVDLHAHRMAAAVENRDGRLLSTFIRQTSTGMRQYKITVLRAQKTLQQTNRNKRHKKRKK